MSISAPLVQSLLASGHKLSVLAPEDETFVTLRGWGCDCHDLLMDVKGISPGRDLALMLRMWRAFRRLKPDLVLSFTIKNNVFGALAARTLDLPFVPTVTGLGTAFLSGRGLQRISEHLYHAAFRSVSKVVFQNEDDVALFLDRRLVRQTQIVLSPGSGIDITRFQISSLPDTGDGTIFLMIARLLAAKGVREFVEAARFVQRTRPDARFQLLGPAESKNRHTIGREELDDWINEGIVEYLGETDDVRPMIEATHCIVLPSYREGTPRTLLEAGAMARPVIATDVPGCRQIVEDTVTGLLCEAQSAASLARRIHDFLSLPATSREAMGSAGRRKIEEVYDAQIVNEIYVTLVRNVGLTRA